ncbi:MAG TPA: thioredoxin [Ohtaekwangia sp.]|uniref:thioredoxin n=1 Tax=Ohtaekwangia sp. TaxID=2066019 RepID=UPI002F93764D
MYRIKLVYLIVMLMSASVVMGQQKTQLTTDEFEAKLQQTPDGQIVDVRTPEEFKKNHLGGAFNMNINSKEFESMVSALDKNKPVMVYCLSGGRSAKAAEYMRSHGFKEVYEMTGGMMQWTAQHKPYEAGAAPIPGMPLEEFNSKVTSDKIVLVDFYAKWCAPCKKMAPWLEELSTRYADRLTLLKINADENSILTENMKVQTLPTIILYKNGKQVWSKTGLAEKIELEKNIQANL